jgi:hypothetical protein
MFANSIVAVLATVRDDYCEQAITLRSRSQPLAMVGLAHAIKLLELTPPPVSTVLIVDLPD